MANEWFVQHGGKQYGPMTSANLKKLAAERKITPATSVRLGAEGAWVPASKVQGLFAAPPPAPRQAQPAQPKPAQGTPVAQRAVPKPPQAAPDFDPLAEVPVAQPAPPPMASGVAQPPWARRAAAPTATAENAGLAAKILGAVAIIFGAVALATFWLPMLSSPLGWTGIAVGGLGLLIGIGGLVVAALSNGSGLILNVAGTSSSAVGLVLAVVLGVTFGMFTSTSAPAPQPQIVQLPVLPPSLPPAEPPPAEPEPEPEPAPPPEPVWTDAGQPIEQGPIKATIEQVAVEQVRLESVDLSTMRRQKPKPMLKVRVSIENTSSDKIVEVPGWSGTGDLLGGQLGQLVGGDAGQALQSATATAKLTDNVDNKYKQTPAHQVFGTQVALEANHAVRPGGSRQAELVFDPPLESIEYLRLELSPAGFGGTEALRFQIPRTMISGLPAPAGG